MGYTHYWTQKRDWTPAEWLEVRAEIEAILKFAEHDRGIPLGDGAGDGGTSPEIGDNAIWFNGLGEDAHETMGINRVRPKLDSGQPKNEYGADLCKTARKPYDQVVTACLCYLSSVTESHCVSSDGVGSDFLAGLELARQALPRYANVLDLPLGIMEDDRWCHPWVSCKGSGFDVRFCVDGRGYVMRVGKGLEEEIAYAFPTHKALGEFLETHKTATFKTGGKSVFGSYGVVEPNIWKASGSFDEAREKRIARAQAKVLKTLFPIPPEHQGRPPLFVRPNEFPPPANGYAYSLGDLLNISD